MSGPPGPLWASGYHQGGKESASFGGTDNTGISEAAWFVDNKPETAAPATIRVPCPAQHAGRDHAHAA
jgi:hypothetical protein